MASWKDKLALIAQRNRQEIVKAKLDRREMMRLGLLTAGGSLIAKAGLSSRAFGAGRTDGSEHYGPAEPAGQAVGAPDAALTVKKPVSPQTCRWAARRHHADRRGDQADQPSVLLLRAEPGRQLRPAASRRRSSTSSPRRKHRSSCIPTTRPPTSGVRRPGSRAADPGQVRRADHGAVPQPPAVGEDPAGLRHRRDHHPSAQRAYAVGERRQPGQLLQLDQRSRSDRSGDRVSRSTRMASRTSTIRTSSPASRPAVRIPSAIRPRR